MLNTKSEKLRQKAEKQLKNKNAGLKTPDSEADIKKLIHELQVHQIELEMQNDELRLAKSELAKANEKYTSLYDFAPSGYITLSKEGKITGLNFAGAEMFGKERSELIGSRFGFFVAQNDKRAFNLFLEKVFNSNHRETCELILSENGNKLRYVYLAGIVLLNSESCLVTMIDISERKRAEEEIKNNLNLRDILLDNLPHIALIVKKQNQHIVAGNKLALNAGAVIGKACYETLFNCDKKCLFCKTPELWETGLRQYAGVEYLGKFYEAIWIPFSDDLYVHYLIDVSDYKGAEKDLNRIIKKLKDLYQRQDEIRENERKAISREIHDELGQSLSALKIDLGWIKDNTENNNQLKMKLNGMTEIVNSTIKTVQRISAELRPGLIDDIGLVSAMEWYCQEFEKRTEIKCHLDLEEIEFEDERKNLAFYRILQEALTNVARHAHANNISILLYKKGNSVFFKITDDGKGMKKEKTESYKSLGIIGIKERVQQFNGSINITSAINKGTTITVVFPYIYNE